MHEPNRRRAIEIIGAGKCHEIVVIEMMIRERDERLAPTAVMPPQPLSRQPNRTQDIEHTFKIAEVVGVFQIVVVVDHAVEERGGRQLLLVPGNHQLASAINRTDGIPREHLRSLVKDDDIELKLGRFQVRADSERTHHQARLESDK